MHCGWGSSCFDEPPIFFAEIAVSFGKVTEFAEIGGGSKCINAKRPQHTMIFFP
jgi:hypothetical protein